jgi:DNA-binding response OmpR family regulator
MKRILVVDDDPAICDATTLVLMRAGFLVETLPDAEPLLENQYPHPDLYILDKQLSGVDGLDVCRFLKSQDETKHIPIIMLSASPQIITIAKTYGADAALEKPFKMQDLRMLVSRLISSSDSDD